jgi:hypothetical protein
MRGRRIYIRKKRDGGFVLVWGGIIVNLTRAEMIYLVSEIEQQLKGDE